MGERFDIVLAGVGMGGPAHTTLETLRELRRARVVFSLSIHDAWLRRVCRRLVPLHRLYYTGEEDTRVYRRLADLVLAEAERRPGVVFVDDGHPLIYDDMCQDVVRRGRRRGLRVRVLPAVSSLDTMVAECGVPFDPTGLQIVEATSLVASRQALNPIFETLVLQIGWFGQSLLVAVEGHTAARFAPLIRHLRRFYPAAHRVRVLRLRQGRRDGSPVFTCRLDQLGRHHGRIATDATLHLPALPDEGSYDDAFARGTVDRERLEKIARLKG